MFLDEIYASNHFAKPIDPVPPGTSDRRRSRSSNRPGSRDGSFASGRSRNVSISSSVEQQENSSAHSSKRSSIFSLRPKSSMATHANDGSIRARTPSAASATVHFRRTSVASERPMSPTDSEVSTVRLPFGRNGRKSRASVRSPSPMDADDEGKPRRRHRDRQKRGSSLEPPHPDLGRISAPFGFQHIARIEKEGLPTALKKMQPQALQPPPEEMRSSLAMRGDQPRKGPPPLRPKRSDELLTDMLRLGPPPIQEIRQIRSAESFEQASKISMLPPLSSIPPLFPPSRRTSNRVASTRAMFSSAADYIATPELYGRPQTARELTFSGEWDKLLPMYDPRPATSSRSLTSPTQVRPPQIPEYKPLPPISTPFSVPLELVPEEPEGTLSARQSMEARRQSMLRRSAASPLLPPLDFMSKDDSKPALGLEEERPSSRMSDTLGKSRYPETGIKALDTTTLTIQETKSTPAALTDIDLTWEEDIDYCYEHEAESHCDFDWNNVSILHDATTDDEMDEEDDEPMPLPWERKKGRSKDQENGTLDSLSTGDSESLQPSGRRFYHMSFNYPEDPVPELDRHSAHTGSTNSFSASTPSDRNSDRHDSTPEVDLPVQIHSSSPLVLTPQLPPMDTKPPLSTEQMYHDLLSGIELSTEARPPPLEIPAKSRLRRNSQKQNNRPAAPTSVPASELVEENNIPSLPLAETTTAEHAPKPPIKLTLSSMVAALRGQDTPSSPSTPTERSRPATPSRNPFRSRSRSRSRSRPRKPSESINEPIPPTPTIPKATSMENLIAPIPLRANKPLTPPETPASTTNSPAKFDAVEMSVPRLPGTIAAAWSSTPSLHHPGSGYAGFLLRNDSPPATPSLPKGLSIDTTPAPLIPHSLFVREPKSPMSPPSPQFPLRDESQSRPMMSKKGIPPSLDFVDYSESDYAGSSVEVPAALATPATPRAIAGTQTSTYSLFPIATPGTPRGRRMVTT